MKIEVGQTVYVEGIQRRTQTVNLRKAIVSKVGRKYFELDGYYRDRFNIDTLLHDGGDYSPSYKVWLNESDYSNHIHEVKLRRELPDMLRKASYKQLVKINSILNTPSND